MYFFFIRTPVSRLNRKSVDVETRRATSLQNVSITSLHVKMHRAFFFATSGITTVSAKGSRNGHTPYIHPFVCISAPFPPTPSVRQECCCLKEAGICPQTFSPSAVPPAPLWQWHAAGKTGFLSGGYIINPVLPILRGETSVILRLFLSVEHISSVSFSRSQKYNGPS